MLGHISADSLRGHLSFIASDLLEGRATPSRGLDLAAEYIAAQFRRAGLEPAGDDGYYQTADLVEVQPVKERYEMRIEQGDQSISIPRDEITPRFYTSLDLSPTGVYKLDAGNEAAVSVLKPEDVHDKVLVTQLPDFSGDESSRSLNKFNSALQALDRAKPKLTLMLVNQAVPEYTTRLVFSGNRDTAAGPRIMVTSPAAVKWFASLAPGASDATFTLRLPASAESKVKLHNVIGLLRGSDPVLKDTYILVTAHYDHLGMKPDGAGDRVYNGANDDGSGTVSVIELASALATSQPRPKRSIVFMTFFGEEEGLFGSRYYARHPVFPIEKTIANVNLEQVGRTDSTQGPKISEGFFTGFEHSDVPQTFRKAGALTGVKVLSDKSTGGAFFDRSDNAALAAVGVPAHTFVVAFEFPDYHAVGDEWQKINYDNMVKVDRMLALGLIMLADSPQAPKWNQANPKTEPYVTAWKERHEKASGTNSKR